MIGSLHGYFLFSILVNEEAMGSIPIRFSDDTNRRVIASTLDVLQIQKYLYNVE